MPKVTLDDWRTNYVEFGSGSPVIFLHGVGMDHTMWEFQVQELASNYRVIAYDMLCHGDSEKIHQPLQLEDFVTQLRLLMKELNLSKAHIVGFSMGGMVAQKFAWLHPELVETVTFMNTVAKRTEKEQEAVLSRVERVKAEGHLATVESAIDRWFTKEFINQNPDIIQKIRLRLQNNDGDCYINAYQIFANADQFIWQGLKNIKVPVLIITAENDVGSTPEMARRMHERITHSKLVIIDYYRHMLPIEGYESVNQELNTFFTEVSK